MLGCNWRTGHCDPQGARDKAERCSRQGASKSVLKVQSCGRSMTRVHPSPCFPSLPYSSPQHTTHLVSFPLSMKALASSARFCLSQGPNPTFLCTCPQRPVGPTALHWSTLTQPRDFETLMLQYG